MDGGFLKVLTNFDVGLLCAWHVLVRSLWAGAAILIAMLLFDAEEGLATKLAAAAFVVALVWSVWLVLTIWIAKAGIPKSADGARYEKLSAAAKARLIAAYSGFG